MQIGPYTLGERLAAGGMGEVWRAENATAGGQVALKLVRADRASHRAALRDEIRAVARLDHPHVVRIFDHGALTAPLGTFSAGTPWLAMELCAGGTLAERGHAMRWNAVRQAMLELLDALAHVHARGLLHRDVKPSNILFRPRGLILADFGMGYETSGSGASLSGGTPAYMSPEQVLYQRRSLGPWTDLFAVGVVVWELVTRSRPWGPDDPNRVDGVLPTFTPVIRTPAGLDRWLGDLLAPNPRHRFRWAADAAHALLQLPGVDADGALAPAAAPSSLATLATLATGTWARVGADAPPAPIAPQATRFRPGPPVPHTWRRPDAPVRTPITGAEIALLDLRAAPLVGRHAERDRIWQALRGVHREGAGCAVVVVGPAGVGKTALARAVAQRAHELGAAQCVRIQHNAIGNPREEVAAALTAAIAGPAPEPSRLLDAAAALRPPDDPTEPIDLLRALSSSTLSSRAWQDAVATLLRWWCRVRPVVVWIDDVNHGPPSLDLLARVQDADIPVLAVATARRAPPGVDPATLITLGPLSERDTTDLLDGLLELSPDIRRRVVERSGGNPSFALSLVRDWATRGALVPGQGGYTLAADVDLPSSAAALWHDTAAKVIAGLSPGERVALELAAALGHEVDDTEWRSACNHAGVAVPAGLPSALADHHLVAVGRGRWSFAQAMLRDALLHLSAERAARHLTCAAILDDDDRKGQHLLAGGAPEAAWEPLRAAAQHAMEQGAHDTAARALADLERCLANAPAEDPRWGTLWAKQANLAMGQGDLKRCLALTEWVTSARAAGEPWRTARVEARLRRAAALGPDPNREPEVLALLRAAVDDATGTRLETVALGSLMDGAPVDEAEALYHRGVALGGRAGWLAELHGRGQELALQRGDLDEAERRWSEGFRFVREQGNPLRHALYLEHAASMACLRGDAAAAVEHATAAVRRFDEQKSVRAEVTREVLGRALALSSRYGEAIPLLTSASEAAARYGLHLWSAVAHFGLAVCLPDPAWRDSWEAAMRPCSAYAPDSSLLWLCERYAAHLHDAGEDERAGLFRDFVLASWPSHPYADVHLARARAALLA